MPLMFVTLFAVSIFSYIPAKASPTICTSPYCSGADLVYSASGPDGRGGVTCFEVRRENNSPQCRTGTPTPNGAFEMSCGESNQAFRLKTQWRPYPRWNGDVVPLTMPNEVLFAYYGNHHEIAPRYGLRCSELDFHKSFWCRDEVLENDPSKSFVQFEVTDDKIRVKFKASGERAQTRTFRHAECELNGSVIP